MKRIHQIIGQVVVMCFCLMLTASESHAQSTGVFDTVIASNVFQQSNSSSVNYFMGKLGVGTNAAETTLDVNGTSTLRGDVNLVGNTVSNGSFLGSVTSTSSVIRVSSLPNANVGVESVGYAVPDSTSTNCTWIGFQALNGSPGIYNTALGRAAIYGAPGSYNTGVGELTLYTSVGDRNTAVGKDASRESIGTNNASLGVSALEFSPGNDNTAVGYQSLFSSAGRLNTAVGSMAMQSTTGEQNTGVGCASLLAAPGVYNSALGYYAGTLALGDCNISIGWYSSFYAQGSYNAIVGTESLESGSGDQNATLGHATLYYAIGSNNVAVGFAAGQLSSGMNNTYVGSQSGHSCPGVSNTFIGAVPQNGVTQYFTNATTLGAGAWPKGNKTVAIGLADQTTYIDGALVVSNGLTIANILGDLDMGTYTNRP